MSMVELLVEAEGREAQERRLAQLWALLTGLI